MNTIGSVYIHIPFCRRLCSYCAFCRVLYDDSLAERLVGQLCDQRCNRFTVDRFRSRKCTRAGVHNHPACLRATHRQATWSSRAGLHCIADQYRLTCRTVYIGGGTPTSLPEALLRKVLHTVGVTCGDRIEEYTVEANPESLTDDKMQLMQAYGVTRLSIGVQSLQDDELTILDRLHNRATAIERVGVAVRAGFASISVDLMYGLPGQTIHSWRDTLQGVVDLGVDHVSCYALTLEEGTALADRYAQGIVAVPDDDAVADMYTLARQVLDDSGFVQYELSNFARAGHECRHNINYWQQGSYLGFGPSAVSYVDRRRYTATHDIAAYVGADNVEQTVISSERLEGVAFAGETMMLALRQTAGVSREAFQQRCGMDYRELFGQTIDRLVADGLLVDDGGRIRLAEMAYLVADGVLAEFVV